MSTFDDDGTLLRPLDHEPSTPCTVDIRRAVRDGRRRRRLRRTVRYTSFAAIAVLVLAGTSLTAGALRDTGQANRPDVLTNQAAATPGAATPPTAPALAPPTACTVQRLPIPDGVDVAQVTGADPTGRIIVGRSHPRSGDYQIILWRDGQATKVPLDGLDPQAQLADVTTNGVAVGFTYERVVPNADRIGPVPYVYRGGALAKLTGVRYGEAYGINEAGRIVGVDSDRRRPVVWPSPAAAATDLPLPAGVSIGEARAIDEDGTIVGNLGDRSRAHVWLPDGTHRDLPLPKVNGETAFSAQVYSIRNGWATGMAEDITMNERAAVRWNVRTGEVRIFADFYARANTANARGWMVGTDLQGRAVLRSDAGLLVLPDLATHRAGALTNVATTLSDDGRTIAGQADDLGGTIHAVVWHCQ